MENEETKSREDIYVYLVSFLTPKQKEQHLLLGGEMGQIEWVTPT